MFRLKLVYGIFWERKKRLLKKILLLSSFPSPETENSRALTVLHSIHSSLSPQHEILCVSACCFFTGKMYYDTLHTVSPISQSTTYRTPLCLDSSHKSPIQRLSSTMNFLITSYYNGPWFPMLCLPLFMKVNPTLSITGVFLETMDQDGDSIRFMKKSLPWNGTFHSILG